MEFPNVNAIPHPSAASEAVPYLRPVTPVEPVARVDNEDAGRMERNSEYTPTMPNSRAGELEFRVDENTDRLVVSIYDDRGEVMRQIPAEVVLKMAEQITAVIDADKAPVVKDVAVRTDTRA